MRIGLHTAFRVWHADHLKQSHGTLPTCLFAQVLVHIQHFGQLIANFEHRVQSRLRLLEDHGDAVAAHFDHFFFGSLSRFCPSSKISPSSIRPGLEISRMIEREVTLLPQPDSPTSPSTSPGYTSKLTPSTARNIPSSV